VSRERDYYVKVSEDLSSVIAVLGGIVTSIFALGAALGALITMHGAVSQRTREIGVMRALGFGGGAVLLAFVLEAALLALLGGALGCALAYTLRFVEFTTMNDATGQELKFRFLASAGTLFGALGAGAVVGVVGGLFPAIKASRVDPIRAMRV
jgi:putative ABC transport system permease protein